MDSSLVSRISFPGEGIAYTPAAREKNPADAKKLESPDIPAAFTFVGQFIDHDLTMNAVNLFDTQSGAVQNTASPLIDLDSVYGARTRLTNIPADGIVDDTGRFRMQQVSSGSTVYYDLLRDDTHHAYISDARNDENQMVLQVHMLIERVHNKFIDGGMSFTEAYLATLFHWQSVLIDDYLTRVLYKNSNEELPQYQDTLTFLLGELKKPAFGAFVYKPMQKMGGGYVASLPHEFAIGFRFGHSQLKAAYLLRSNQTQPVPLFNNLLAADSNGNYADLRGSQPLIADHVIEWEFFAATFKSNLIDGKVTSVVFNLPESAIPDDIKFVGNLVQRNLIRSSQVGLCCGEDLAALYGVPALVKKNIDNHAEYQPLYMLDRGIWRTPLWFYLLKEAERDTAETGAIKGSLGKLGSRLLGEVILGAIAWGPNSVLNQPGWTPGIPTATPGKVTLLDLARFVA